MKTLEDKARRLVDSLQTILEEVHGIEKKNAAAHAELSWQELRALHAVGRGECCPMRRLADAVCLSLSSATGLIDRLVAKKLVKRDRAADDRRVVEVALTDEGRALNERTIGGAAAYARGLLENLDGREQEELLGLLDKIARGIDEKRRA
ncbi:MAG: MarR family transcriptional regulator [Elusimicrobia bacterium]|nr:MarR family transcriptional regulator [Elusimicrobiota bacterium]